MTISYYTNTIISVGKGSAGIVLSTADSHTSLPSAAILQTGLLQPALTGIIGLRSTHLSPESVLNYKVKVIPATSLKHFFALQSYWFQYDGRFLGF